MINQSIFVGIVAVVVLVVVVLPNRCTEGRVYKRCELARELALKQVSEDQIGDWLCIAQHGSKMNTSAVNLKYKRFGGSAYYGIFQISDLYGCLRSSSICGLTCADLKDDDIEDDIDCTRTIYEEYHREIGDGFAAWPVYKTHCRDPASKIAFGDCLNEEVIRFQAYYKKKQKKAKQTDLVVKAPAGKVYDRCELAVELRDKHKIPADQIATWVCIAYHESRFDTSALGRLNADGSGDHGLFQISDIYWCSITSKPGKACGVTCEDMRNNDISDDVRCIQTIYDEHQRISGNGFNAWAVYKPYCQDREESFAHSCFDDRLPSTTVRPRPGITAPTYPVGKFAITSVGKIYDRCELANDLLHKYHMPKEQIATWVCIAFHESSFNTSAEGRLNADGSGDHGLFQISDIYWCSPPGNGWACSVSCEKLKDNDIADDVKCVKIIYEEHQRLSGDGFNAWSVYKPHCQGKSESYTRGCFGSDDEKPVTFTLPKPAITAPTTVPPRKTFVSRGKVYTRCALARELYFTHHYSAEETEAWTCIAQYQSNFNTSAVGIGPGSVKYHGMFQLSDEYWCSPPGRGTVCGLPCSDLEDDDLTDDLACMRHIYEEHQRISGDGFNAWAVYQPYCKGKAQNMIKDCFKEAENALVPTTPSRRPTKKKNNIGVGKVYERCELARELYNTHHLPLEQIATWVCIAHRESNYNVSAIGRLNADGSGDHGLFQISDIYWCSPPGKGWVCGVSCSDLEDNDLTDDVECMRTIFEEHTRLSGDGFNAWAVYQPYCKGRSEHYIKGCFEERTTTLKPKTTTTKPTTTRRPTFSWFTTSTSTTTSKKRITTTTTKRPAFSWFTPSTPSTTIKPSTTTRKYSWSSTTMKPTLPPFTSRTTPVISRSTTPRSPSSTKSTTSLYDFYLNHFGRPNTTPASYASFTFRPRSTPKTASPTIATATTTRHTRSTSVSSTAGSTAKYSNFDTLFDNFKHG
ncbi:uncharacterized protein LOC129765267 [Toxorhynchites rutilus septentrionalis]|uniref:uncharacterized protein LOC129765267 n=1 Tax=Toxorhynchites rutilus septentrionalis TaxID=329112 RepID=UPI00247A5DF0|nr:uncharacterized protein LOC129765267 [Toxorhynchites rutilus septentrionalis]